MDRMLADIQALNDELRSLREQMHDTTTVRDLHEKLVAGATEKADKVASETSKRLRQVITVVAAGLLVWTPVVAYAAVWAHERVRNSCYPVAALVEGAPVDEPWYCGAFPGTNRHDHEEIP